MSGEGTDPYKGLDLALRIGEILLRSGAGAADVTATMIAVTEACGVKRVSADVTFIDLALRHQPSPDEPAAIQVRRVDRRPVDYELLTRTDRLVHDLLDGTVTRDEARAEVARLVSAGHQRRRWAIMLGLGVMGSAIALRLGGDAVVCALAFIAACAIDSTQRLLQRRQVPMFFQQLAGGMVATVIALVASASPLDANPSRVVTAGIVMLLAGIGLLGAAQDAILGFPVTASARLLEAMLATVGIIGGVTAGFALRGLLGVELARIKPGAVGIAEAGMIALGTAVAASAFAYASYAAVRAMVAVAVVAGASQVIATAVGGTSLGETFGVAVAAVTIGAVSHAASGRISVPPLVIVVPAIVPFLPGLAIYKGLALLAEGKDGIPDLATAAVTAVALATGVILGQYAAQPVRRGARFWEARLAGPRLAGPLIARRRRPERTEPGPS